MRAGSGFDTGYASKSSDLSEQAATSGGTVTAIAILSFLMVSPVVFAVVKLTVAF